MLRAPPPSVCDTIRSVRQTKARDYKFHHVLLAALEGDAMDELPAVTCWRSRVV